MSRTNGYELEDIEGAANLGASSNVPRPGFVRIVMRWWWISVVMIVAGLGGSLAYLLRAEDIYESSAFLRVTANTQRIFKEDAFTAQDFSLETECGVITSAAVLGLAVDKLLDPKLGTFVDPEADSPDGKPTPLDQSGRIRLLKEIVSAQVVKGRDIICITCESPYPNDAADIANAVAKAYGDYQNSQERTSVGKVLAILDAQEGKQGKSRDAAFTDLTNFRRSHSQYTFGSGGAHVATSGLATLTQAQVQARLAYFDAEAAFEAAQQAAYGGVRLSARDFLNPPVPAAAPADSPTDGEEGAAETKAKASLFPPVAFPEAVRRLAETQAARGAVIPTAAEDDRLDDLLAAAKWRQEQMAGGNLPETSPKRVTVREEIKKLTERVAQRNVRFAQTYLTLVGEQLKSAEARRTKISDLLVEAQQRVRTYNELSASYDQLESKYVQAKRIVDALTDQIDKIRISEGMGLLNIDSLESAEAALEPSKPHKLRIYLLGAVAGLFVGVGLSFLRDWLDHRIRSAEEITAVLGVPVIGAVPDMGGKKEELAYRGQLLLQAPSSGVAEAVRSIRTGLVFSTNGDATKTILFTSPDRGDGKSTMVANLGIALAQAGRRTLVVDTDFRRPVQQKIFGLNGSAGLADVLGGRAAIGKAVHATEVEGLEVLPCGTEPSNPSEMLNSEQFRATLTELSQQYDCVLFDSPPTGPVTDALILGALCDRTLLVLRAEETTRRSAQHARDGLLSVGSRLMGAVINAVPRRRGGLYSFDGYDGYRAYGQPPAEAADAAPEGT